MRTKPQGGVRGSTTPRTKRPVVVLVSHRSGKKTYRQIKQMAPMDRINLVKRGVPAALVVTLVDETGMTRERLYGTVGVARATVDRKVKEDKPLSRDEGEGMVALVRLIAQVEQIMAESGDPDCTEGFDAGRWVATFLETPHPALGGVTPGSLMDTAEGRELVTSLVARMQSGAYA